MKNNKRYLIISFSVLLFLGCQNKSNVVNDNTMTATKPQQSDSTNINLNTESKNTVSNNDINQIVYNPDSLLLLNIMLPKNWNLDVYKFIDEKGENRGDVSAINYMDNFDLLIFRPNHCIVTKDEYIDIPLGKCRLITLDADNGTAASGITGTHDVYYAGVPIKGKAIYMLNFTKNDKKPETKSQFIEILNKLSFK